MAERKSLSKKLRFEVFKRDRFTCQYCGRASPDVVLEVDHIKPVCNGGNNGIMNLITSCLDCNRGKGKRQLDDSAVIIKQRKQLDDLNNKREQIEMMLKWREELLEFEDKQVDFICEYFHKTTVKFNINEKGKTDLKKLIHRFGYEEVFISTEISIDKYFKDSEYSAQSSFNKIGGICYNRKFREGKTYGY